ncbi:MAG TPA: ribonuclease E/G [Asticcacaulis sp.]|nr:ribonuclease E/G [Asticcacaulis sp.]
MIQLAYESRFGLARGALLVKGRPFLYQEGLENDPALDRLGVVSLARLTAKAGGMAFLTLADGAEAILDAQQEVLARLPEGAAVEIEIAAEARADKRARARFLKVGQGALRRLSPVESLRERLLAQAGDVAPLDDPEALDAAEAEALSPSGPMTGGGYLSLERTRALIACDVDAGAGEGVLTPRAFAKACNERAMAELARRLRLSGLAGLVVVDLIGKRHDGARLTGLLREAFGDEPIQIGALGKFGTLEFVRPWAAAPLMDRRDDPLRHAHLLLREAARRAEPGRFLTLRAPATTLDRVRALLAGSLDPLAAVMRLESATQTEVMLT